MRPETTVLSEASQKEEDETHTRAPVCGIQPVIRMNLWVKQKQTQGQRADWWLLRRRGRNRVGGRGQHRLVSCMDWTAHTGLLDSTGRYIQHPMGNYGGKEFFKKECIYIYNCTVVINNTVNKLHFN